MDTGRYLALFLTESRARLSGAAEVLRTADGIPAPGGELDELFRHVHSLKGMAATMGQAELTALAHAAEDVLASVREGALAAAALPPALIRDTLAIAGDLIDELAAGNTPIDARTPALVARLRAISGAPAPQVGAPGDRGDAPDDASPSGSAPRLSIDVALPEESVRSRTSLAVIRAVGAIGRVDTFLPPGPPAGPSGSLTLSATVVTDEDPEAVRRTIAGVAGEDATVRVTPMPPPTPSRGRFRAVSVPTSFVRIGVGVADDLLAAAAELVLAHEALRASPGGSRDPETSRETERCARLARRLHQAISAVRRLPFETIAPGLVLGARDAAARLGRSVRVDITGRHVGIDRAVLDALVDPLLHLVRNAVAHGIEDVAARIDAGKPGVGTISIAVVRERDRIRIDLADDGRGLDLAAIRRAAGETADGEDEPDSDARILDLVTRAGLSTAQPGSVVAGRGVGLDVVRREVERLGGRLHVRSTAGSGATFRIELPQTQAVVPSLLFRLAEDTFAVPIHSVDRTFAVDGASGREAEALVPLADRLGLPSRPREARRVAIVPAACRGVGLLVDEVLGRRDILVRPLDPPLRNLRSYAGAALLDDGTVALVLDPTVLEAPLSPGAG